MGSSTGNMLVDNHATLNRVFSESEMLIATHCEDERIIRRNYENRKALKPELQPMDHPLIRDEEACLNLHCWPFSLPRNTTAGCISCTSARRKNCSCLGICYLLNKKRSRRRFVFTTFILLPMTTTGWDTGSKCNPAIKAPP